jgi:hypothetical protein
MGTDAKNRRSSRDKFGRRNINQSVFIFQTASVNNAE